MKKTGSFCETYGNTIHNCILEFILENQDLDFAIGDMAIELNISKPKAYEVINYFQAKGYVKKSRVVGKTQLYILNKQNKRVKLLLYDFKQCLKFIVEESENNSSSLENKHLKNSHVDSKIILGS